VLGITPWADLGEVHLRALAKLVSMNQGEMVPDDIRKKIDERISDWLSNRKGTPVGSGLVARRVDAFFGDTGQTAPA
jgi:hypothetical protein